MGELDQLVKDQFTRETERATQGSLRFEVPKETPTTEIHLDGLLHVLDPAKAATLPVPWSLAQRGPLVLEFKMQGDKLDEEEFDRALLRRQAQQCAYNKNPNRERLQLPLWLITAHLRDWMHERHLVATPFAGVYRLEPRFYEVYLIAANELPLQAELLPFLVTRTGEKLVDLLRWMLKYNPKAVPGILKVVPMSKANYQALNEAVQDENYIVETLRGQDELLRSLARIYGLQETLHNEGRQEGIHEGQAATLQRQAEKRLKRPLNDEEQRALLDKFDRLGLERFSDVLLDSNAEQFGAWLCDPAAV